MKMAVVHVLLPNLLGFPSMHFQCARSTGDFECLQCSFVYKPDNAGQGALQGTQFEDLPSTWVCPVCKAPKVRGGRWSDVFVTLFVDPAVLQYLAGFFRLVAAPPPLPGTAACTGS